MYRGRGAGRWTWSRMDRYLCSAAGPGGHADIAFSTDRAMGSGRGWRPWLLMEQATQPIYADGGGEPGARPDAPGRPRLRGRGAGTACCSSSGGLPGRGGDVALRDGAARRAGHGGVPRGRRARRGRAAARRGGGQHGNRAGRRAAGHRFLVGAGQPRTARRGPALPGGGAARSRRAVPGRHRLRPGPARRPTCPGTGCCWPRRCTWSPTRARVAAPDRGGWRRAGRLVRQRAGQPAGQVRLGGYPGALRDLLGVRVEEFFPLPDGETVPLSSGARGAAWSELMTVTGARVLASYAAGPLAGPR